MGNTVRRPRKRPRKNSVNFRSLWWLLAREAAWCIWASAPDYRQGRARAGAFVRWDARRVEWLARDTLLREPQRRNYP